jgi:transposase-like protein
VADLLAGVTQRDAAKKHGVSPGTIAKWALELETKHNEAEAPIASVSIEARKQQFTECLIEYLESTVRMAKSWTEICSDPDFVREKPQVANELGRTCFEFADRVMAKFGNGQSADGQD